MRKLMALGLLLSLCGVRTGLALPPPWDIEAMKAKADLIAICRVGMVMGNERVLQAALSVVQVLQPSSFEGKSVRLSIPRPPMEIDGRLGTQSQGTPAMPEPEGGETVLVFLQKQGANYTVVCGKDGYIVLKGGSEEERAATIKKIEEYRQFAAKIGDEAVRAKMDELYQKVVDYVRTMKAESPTLPILIR